MEPMSAGAVAALRAQYVGLTLHEVPTPSVALDLDKLEVNCRRMLEATDRLGLQWRAHIKTHKTIELTRLQVGEERTTPARIIVSTIVEAENVMPLLKEYQSRGREVNVLYAFPLYPSAIARLAKVFTQLGRGALSVMVDHIDQVPLVIALSKTTGHPPPVFVKIDTGYGRAGVPPESPAYAALVAGLVAAERSGEAVLHGLYSHAGHSYDSRSDWAAMRLLVAEFEGLRQAAEEVARARGKDGHAPSSQALVLSVGATPTSTTLQHPSLGSAASAAKDSTTTAPTETLSALVSELRAAGLILEVHAGVYPTLDLQQLATHARDARLLSVDDLAVSVVAEVASLYPGRGHDGTAEALINAGSLALGREPVKDTGISGVEGGTEVSSQSAYAGWGWVMTWGGLEDNPVPGTGFPAVAGGGWQVGRISQEHGILTWLGRREDEVPLRVGQRVRIWPNHSCIAGAGFDYYLIVDSRKQGREDEVVDVWPRWRGW